MNKPQELPASVVAAAIAELRGLLGDRLSTNAGVREHHGKDESSLAPAAPDAVAFPRSTEEVRDIVNICRHHGMPLIPFGAGTSVEGQVLAVRGGLTLDMSGMNRVIAVHESDLDAVVEAGVTRKQLNETIRHTGLFFPIDPGADATLGGMAATRASGTNAVRYGTMRENVLALTVVLADGRIIRTARRARKSSAGYDLTRLFVGSEGTLGVITEVTVRLYAMQEAMSAAVCRFPTMADAVNTVIQAIQSGIPIARSEFLCQTTIRAINAYSKSSHPEEPHLFFEFHGTTAGVKEQAVLVQAIAAANNGSGFQWASRTEERNQLWQARHDTYFACLQLRPGSRAIATDVCVPLSRLTECIVATQADVAEHGATIPIFGHVGDGNFHCVVLLDPDDPQDVARARAFNRRLVERALAMEGTCTGEHGIGLGKQEYLRAELGEAVDLMSDIKRLLDPGGLMNPGKVVMTG
jgi:D-lactate dehydrogenase (cytochrome)